MRLILSIRETESIKVSMNESDNIYVGFSENIQAVAGETYTGPYEATSLVANDYELATENKTMTQNVTIKKIPYEAVSNPQGGNTVTIGGY